MSNWGGHNDDGYIEESRASRCDADEYRRDMDTKAALAKRKMVASIKYLTLLREEPDGHPFTHVDGFPINELNQFIEGITR